MSLKNILTVLLFSMVPILELRAAIPLGAAMGMPWEMNFLISVIGNFLPVPFILLFIRRILDFMKKVPKLEKIAFWLEEKAHKKSDTIQKYSAIGLTLFVGIPLPGTGAWTGALIAALLDLRMKYALPCIALGVLIAGGLVTGVAYGALGFLNFILS